MGETTGIAWTDATWNPWYGCSKVSPGCAHCYMFRDMTRYGRDPETVTRSKTKFCDPLAPRFRAEVLDTVAQSGEARRGRVFTCSWSDWFHEGVDAWRPEAWEIVRATPHFDYQILTKRPDLIPDRLPADWGDGYPNVWLGTSVENQRWDWRVDALRETRARVRFLSCEPLLGELDVSKHLESGEIHWLIAGGESGSDCRPMKLEWARWLRDQCAAAGVPFFLKQLGGWPETHAHEKALLDGRTHTEFPRETANV